MSDVAPAPETAEPVEEVDPELEAALAAQFPTPEPDAVPEVEVPLGDGGGDDGSQPAVVPPEAVPDDAPIEEVVEPTAEQAFDFAQTWKTTYGQDLTEDTARDLLKLVADVSTITPEQWARLNEPEPATQVQPVTPPDEDLWGDADPRLTQVQEQLAAQQAAIEAQQTQQAEQYQTYLAAEVGEGTKEFADNAIIDLTPEDRVALDQLALQSGVFGMEMQRTNGANPRAAWMKALETSLYSSPQFRDRVVDKMADQRAEQRAAEDLRQELASSVGAGGGSAASVPTLGQKPTTMKEAEGIIAAELKKVFDANEG